MPKFKAGDKIALAKVEYRTVLEVVQADDAGYLIKRPYRPFESCTLAHNVEDIDNNYKLVETPEYSTAVAPDGFDIDDPESPINTLAKAEERCRELEEALRWILSHGWRTVHIGRELQKLSLIASREQVKWLHAALEGK